MKKPLITTIIAVALLGLLTYTNPQQDRYESFVQQEILRSTSQQGGLTGIFGSLFGKVAGSLIADETVRKDYVFFSTYETDLGEDRIKAIGALNNFFLLEKPAAWKKDSGKPQGAASSGQ